MLYTRLGALALVALIAWLLVKLWKSPKFDKWCKEVTSGKLNTESTPTDVIKDISKQETVLEKQAEQNIKEAKRLEDEAKKSKDYLSDRGVGSAKKEGSE